MDDRVSLEGLRYARAVAESGSFSAAAKAYGVTQPALSNGIAKLEERLGVKLFDRSPQGAVPTVIGKKLLPLMTEAVAGVDSVLAEARRASGRDAAQSVRLGVSPLIGAEIVARAFAAVRRLETPRDLVLHESDVEGLTAGLVAESLDLVLMPSVGPIPRFEHRVIDSEPVVLVEHNQESGTTIDVRDVANKDLILVPDACGLTRFTKQLFDGGEAPMRVYPGEASGYPVLEQWANLGLGAAILPESRLSSPRAPHRRLSDHGEAVEIFYAAVWSPRSGLSSDVAALVDQLDRT